MVHIRGPYSTYYPSEPPLGPKNRAAFSSPSFQSLYTTRPRLSALIWLKPRGALSFSDALHSNELPRPSIHARQTAYGLIYAGKGPSISYRQHSAPWGEIGGPRPANSPLRTFRLFHSVLYFYLTSSKKSFSGCGSIVHTHHRTRWQRKM